MTPIQYVSKVNGNKLYIKRDDLLGFSFGGNKVRIAQEFFADAKRKGANCIIGYGSSRSNLCRVLANMSLSNGMKCHIISPSEQDGTRFKSNNSTLVNQCGVKVHYCEKHNVAETVEKVIKECEDEGLKPYYINGDKYGNGNERVPLYAYEKTYDEIKEQAQNIQILFDYIFLPTGTGMTQAGLLLGLQKSAGCEKIIGISIARDSEKERETINKFLKCAGATQFPKEKVIVTDKYLCGGYGKYDKEVESTILDVYKKYGIPLDPTYTGKAYNGMLEFLKEKQIANKNILFLHTGGTPLFFDFIQSVSAELDVVTCQEEGKLVKFLRCIDNQLVTPLSARVEITEFAKKVLNKGIVYAIEQDNEIVSAIIFYANDVVEKRGYVTLLGTLPEYQGKGHAGKLLKAMERKARFEGMKKIFLDTDISNTKAVALYSKYGFKVDSIQKKVNMVKEI